MLQFPSPPLRNPWIAATATMALLCAASSAQNFTMQVADPDPLGIGAFVPDMMQDVGLDLTGGIKGDFSYTLRTESEYNSNFFLTDGNEEDEFSFQVTPTVRYTSDPEGGAAVTFSAYYNPTFRAYLDNSDLNDFDHNGYATLRIEGSRTAVSMYGRFAEVSGTDRLTGDFVDGTVFTGGIRATRQIAPRTSLFASWTGSVSDYDSSTNIGAEIYTTSFGGLWQATERFQIGSSLRYIVRESDNIDSVDSWALLMEARYQLGERIWLSASLGPEFSNDSGVDGDESSIRLTGDLNARYVISERLTWTTNLRSASVPSPNETNYLVNDIRLSTALQRRFVRGWLSTGLEYNFSDYEDVGTVTVDRGDENNLSWFTTYRRPLFSERVGLDATLRYTVNDGLVDWDQWLVTMGVNVVF
jgi:hypothetical protein